MKMSSLLTGHIIKSYNYIVYCKNGLVLKDSLVSKPNIFFISFPIKIEICSKLKTSWITDKGYHMSLCIVLSCHLFKAIFCFSLFCLNIFECLHCYLLFLFLNRASLAKLDQIGKLISNIIFCLFSPCFLYGNQLIIYSLCFINI